MIIVFIAVVLGLLVFWMMKPKKSDYVPPVEYPSLKNMMADCRPKGTKKTKSYSSGSPIPPMVRPSSSSYQPVYVPVFDDVSSSTFGSSCDDTSSSYSSSCDSSSSYSDCSSSSSFDSGGSCSVD